MVGDGKLNPIEGVYIPIITIPIPIKGEMTIPNIETFDHGTHIFIFERNYIFKAHHESVSIRQNFQGVTFQ